MFGSTTKYFNFCHITLLSGQLAIPEGDRLIEIRLYFIFWEMGKNARARGKVKVGGSKF